MILAIDVGNTSVAYAIYKGRRRLRSGYAVSDGIPGLIQKLFRNIYSIPSVDIVISSVVPKNTRIIRNLSRRRKGVRLWEVGRNLKVPIKHKYNNIKKLGSDRLIAAYGVMKIYSPPLILLDFGTALTCDYVSKKGIFEGGLIIPGPEISLQALSSRAALLPKLKFPHRAPSLIGRDTVTCMKSGILHGFGAMADGLVHRLKRRFGRHCRVIATGGLASTLAAYSSQIEVVDPLLILKSLARLFRDTHPNLSS